MWRTIASFDSVGRIFLPLIAFYPILMLRDNNKEIMLKFQILILNYYVTGYCLPS